MIKSYPHRGARGLLLATRPIKRPETIRDSFRGMALIAVLWLVAALSIVLGSLSAAMRQETRMMSAKREMVVAQAFGDAAIQLVLQKLRAADRAPDTWAQVAVEYEGRQVQVQIVPLSGLIDLNRADAPLLSRMLSVAGGLSPDGALTTAQAIIAARQQRDSAGALFRFEAEEDLMKVPGITYDLYARLIPLLTVEGRGSSKVNPNAAPVPVLAVLAHGNQRVAEVIHSKRIEGAVGIDMSGLDASLTDTSVSSRAKLTAIIPLDSVSFAHVSRVVDVATVAADGSPWVTYRLSSSLKIAPSRN